MLKAFLMILIGFSLAQCLHISRRINYLPLEKTKTETLSIIGRPYNVYRKNNADHWVYKFRINDKIYTKNVVFKSGKVVRKGKLKRYPSPKKLLENSGNFDEYQEAIKRIKQR